MDRLLERLRKGSGPPLHVNDLAEALDCSRSYIYKLIRAGTLPAGKVGSDYRIPLREAAALARQAGVLDED